MTNIQNFAIRFDRDFRFEPCVSVTVSRHKWLQPIINLLLRVTNAQRQTYEDKIKRVSLDMDRLQHRIMQCIHEQKANGMRPKTVVLGFDQYQEIALDRTHTYINSTLLIDNFNGLRVILNPYINGFVVLDF